MAFKFEELKVWDLALELTLSVHNQTRDFPVDELYVHTSQMKRAADSVALNIAEGSTGQSTPEFKKFIGYAIRSAIEVVACIFIAKKRNLINPDVFMKIYKEVEVIVIKLQALRKNLK
jgi:four helix bundle protein